MTSTDQPLLLREPEVLARTGLSRSTMRRLARAGLFPEPVRIAGTRVIAWDSRAITAWIKAQIGAEP